MGYCTSFEGSFKLNKKLHPKLHEFLNKLAETRRMKRKVSEGLYGVEGEFFVDSKAEFGQDTNNPNVIDMNEPPRTQPGLWCQWEPTEDGLEIKWNDGDKFYEYVDWIEYLIKKILAPNGYVLNGQVDWRGEDFYDIGSIIIKDNEVKIYEGEYR